MRPQPPAWGATVMGASSASILAGKIAWRGVPGVGWVSYSAKNQPTLFFTHLNISNLLHLLLPASLECAGGPCTRAGTPPLPRCLYPCRVPRPRPPTAFLMATIARSSHNAKRRMSGAPAGGRKRSRPAADEQGMSSPQYRGVNASRANRFEAHCWHNGGDGSGGTQLYLGGWGDAQSAALAADIAAVCLKGRDATTNFDLAHYCSALPELARHGIEDVAASLRKLSRSGAAQPTSVFRGVTKHQKGRWEARISAAAGTRCRYTYLGLHATEVAAAMAYDRAALAQKGAQASTNFHISEYAEDLTAEQLAAARQSGLLTDADMALRAQLPQLVDVQGGAAEAGAGAAGAEGHVGAAVEDAGAAEGHAAAAEGGPADIEVEAVQESAEEFSCLPLVGPASPGASLPLALPAWVLASSTSSGSLGTPVSTGSPSSQACEGGRSADQLASLLYDCILQGGDSSPQSVLPTAGMPSRG